MLNRIGTCSQQLISFGLYRLWCYLFLGIVFRDKGTSTSCWHGPDAVCRSCMCTSVSNMIVVWENLIIFNLIKKYLLLDYLVVNNFVKTVVTRVVLKPMLIGGTSRHADVYHPAASELLGSRRRIAYARIGFPLCKTRLERPRLNDSVSVSRPQAARVVVGRYISGAIHAISSRSRDDWFVRFVGCRAGLNFCEVPAICCTWPSSFGCRGRVADVVFLFKLLNRINCLF